MSHATWETVTPLIEDAEQPKFYEPWTPKIGDRVRVRLSGECQVMGMWKVGRAGKSLGIPGGVQPGHPDHINGSCGYIIRLGTTFPGHPYRVRLECSDGPTGYHQAFLAACELEPLS